MIGGTALTSTALATRPCRLAVLGDVARDLAAAGGMADMDGVPQVEVLDHGEGVGGVVVHVVAVARPAPSGHGRAGHGRRRGSPCCRKNSICASQSSDDSGQPWWNTMGWASFGPQSL